ncbi:paraslipin, partial [Lacticaseibacillus rhamnosus]
GFHVLTPFVDVIRYRHSLKEIAIDIPEQVCITRDNVQVGVDGLLYLKILDAERASYGINNYVFAITQLCQTTLRSEVGKIDLDKTFEERAQINLAVVSEVDKASEGVEVRLLLDQRHRSGRVTGNHEHEEPATADGHDIALLQVVRRRRRGNRRRRGGGASPN